MRMNTYIHQVANKKKNNQRFSCSNLPLNIFVNVFLRSFLFGTKFDEFHIWLPNGFVIIPQNK